MQQTIGERIAEMEYEVAQLRRADVEIAKFKILIELCSEEKKREIMIEFGEKFGIDIQPLLMPLHK